MSGHSHFKTIKAQKGLADAKKGKAFSKVVKLISIAAKDGTDPNTNPKLRMAIEQAKIVNMPKDNIERAIERGSGGLVGENLEEVVFEGFGPGGIAIIIEAITDNKNRTLGEIKQILNQNNSKMASEGSVRWMFERKGVIAIIFNSQFSISKDELEMLAIECGADDIKWFGDQLNIYTKPEDLEKIKKNIEEKKITIESATLILVPKNTATIDEKTKQACQKLFESLDENDSVQEIYSNLRD